MCSADEIVECYRRAEEARRMAKAALTPWEKADLVEVEQQWFSLVPWTVRGKRQRGSSKTAQSLFSS
jgi:hypothetical protein